MKKLFWIDNSEWVEKEKKNKTEPRVARVSWVLFTFFYE
jgi:hypothetical protein